MADIKFLVQVDAASGIARIKEFEGTIDKLGTTGAAAGPKFGGLWKQVAAGIISVQALKKAGNELLDFLKDSIKAAAEAESAQKGLEAALFITDRTTVGLAEHYAKYATELMKSTTYDDEAIKGAQALLIQLTRLDQQGLDRATKGVIGLAKVFGMELIPAAELVSKWMEGDMSRLTKYGIHIKDTMTAQEKQTAILDRLNLYYQRATAETETVSGKTLQLKNSINELKESLGGAVIQSESLGGALGDLKSIFDDLATITAPGKTNWIDTLVKNIPIVYVLLNSLKLLAAELELYNAKMKDKAAHEMFEGWIEADEGSLDRLKIILDATTISLDKIKLPIKAASLTLEQQKKIIEDAEKVYKNLAERGMTPVEKEIAEIIERENKLTLAFQAGLVGPEKYRKGMQDLKEWIDEVKNSMRDLSTVIQTPLPLPRNMKALEDFWRGPNIGEAKKIFDTYLMYGRATMQGLDAIFAQGQRNRELALDNEYQARLKYINANIKDETERQNAVMALDAEYDIKWRAMAREQAKAQKLIALLGAIVNTAEAVTKALPDIPLAVLVGALGAIQIGIIAAQPLPLAKGAVFTQPTKFMTERGGYYEAGEAGLEILAPEKKLREIVRTEIGGGRIPVNLNFYISALDGADVKRIVKSDVIPLIQEAFDRNLLRARVQ